MLLTILVLRVLSIILSVAGTLVMLDLPKRKSIDRNKFRKGRLYFIIGLVISIALSLTQDLGYY